jgi:ribosomal-protein-alanine N-acetyltransferase
MEKKLNKKIVLQTERLYLSELTTSDSDAAFMQELTNMTEWIQFIGDRNIKNLEDSKAYIKNRVMPSYEEFGFGFYKVSLKTDDTPLGICGIVKRPTLENVDIGYGFLTRYTRKGYAYEASKATLDYAMNDLNIKKIIAITSPKNDKSKRLLEKLGLKLVDKITESEYGVSLLFSIEKK